MSCFRNALMLVAFGGGVLSIAAVVTATLPETAELLAAPIALQDIPPPGDAQPVDSISFEGAEFTRAFNAAADVTRVVLVFSPT